jgi:hypothetical protein
MRAPTPSASFRGLARRAAAFAGVGVVLYALLFAAAEQLVLASGHSSAFFKIATLQSPSVDWVILGTSHAMPLDFGDTRQELQRQTGLQFVNLAATGAGPLYNRFALEQFLREHRTRNVLFVLDSFAFYSRTWNEDRFEDAKLLARTPLDRDTAVALWHYVRTEGVSPRAWLDYVTGFSKINNRDRFKPDAWEGESQFDRAWRPSASAVDKRMKYLYPDGTSSEARARYIAELSTLIAVATRSGAQVVVVKLPTPPQYQGRLPDEAAFDAALTAALAPAGVPYRDFSRALPQPQFYFDSDHLNRAGVSAFIAQQLLPLLANDAAKAARL